MYKMTFSIIYICLRTFYKGPCKQICFKYLLNTSSMLLSTVEKLKYYMVPFLKKFLYLVGEITKINASVIILKY